MVNLEEIKEIAIAVIAGLVVHYVAKAIDERPHRDGQPKHMR